jgi:ABC-2 type transport system ATP-binding protein
VRVGSAQRREVLRELLDLPDVVDAIIKGRNVRVLIARQADPSDFARSAAAMADGTAEVDAVEPVFEDAFISLLKEPDQEAPGSTHPEPAVPAQPRGDGNGGRSPDARRLATPARDNGIGKPQDAVIEVTGLVRRFGDFTAVDDIDFTVSRGEIFGLLGPNGAGKSTTFKMLCGLLPPSGGEALVIDMRRAAAVARGRIGYMAQKFALYGNMSVLQNLRFFASAYGLEKRTQQRTIEAELSEFGLDPYSDAISETLPLGYKQRLALACAIMHEPGVLFLDEPTSGVDPLVRREFWSRINAMAASGVTVLVTTHFMEEAEYCDRIGIIYQGRLVASGTPEELKSRQSSAETPDPTLEDAFINLIERYDREPRS